MLLAYLGVLTIQGLLMTAFDIVYLLTGAVVVVFLGLFVTASIKEKRNRAAILSLIAMVVSALLWFGSYILLDMSVIALIIPPFALAVLALLFFLPLGQTAPLVTDPDNSRVDERDVIFAREEYEAGSDKYETYYAMRPENKEVDDNLRKLPELLAPGGRYYDPVESEQVDAIFNVIEDLGTEVDGNVSKSAGDWDPSEAPDYVQRLTLPGRRRGRDRPAQPGLRLFACRPWPGALGRADRKQPPLRHRFLPGDGLRICRDGSGASDHQ